MNKLLKILAISLMLLIVGVSVVSAVDMDDFKAPSDFVKGTGDYFDYDDFEIAISPYDKEISYDLFFEDDEDYSVEVDYDRAEYTDKTVDHVGVLEIVTIDGDDYVVECYFDGTDKSKLEDCNDFMDEFNELNDLEPVSI